MSIKDTIKSLEEVDEKLKKAIALEQTAIVAQKNAAAMRDEAQRALNKVNSEKVKVDELYSRWNAATTQKEDELKNRETTLSAHQADFERHSSEKITLIENRNAELTKRIVIVEKREAECSLYKERMDEVGEKYSVIAEFINNTL